MPRDTLATAIKSIGLDAVDAIALLKGSKRFELHTVSPGRGGMAKAFKELLSKKPKPNFIALEISAPEELSLVEINKGMDALSKMCSRGAAISWGLKSIRSGKAIEADVLVGWRK